MGQFRLRSFRERRTLPGEHRQRDGGDASHRGGELDGGGEKVNLTAGARIGPYEIVALLGAGGMGEVYRGRDSRLGRDVALKVLPAKFSADAERMSRFQREAQVLASLNHPHIAALYGLEDAGGVRALVMELVEGPTLAERIRTGPIIGNATDSLLVHCILKRFEKF